MTGPAWRNWGARLRETALAGIPAVTLENPRLRVTVLAGKGADIVEFLDKRRDLDFCWFTPAGVVARPTVAGLAADEVGTFGDVYEGGWQEIFPNGGAPSTYGGVRMGQHAEVATLPWAYEITADTAEAVAVRFTVRTRRWPYLVTRTLRLAADSTALEVRGEVANESAATLRAMWGQHLAFGRPFLRPGCEIRLPEALTVIPHDGPIDPAGRRFAPGRGSWPVVAGADGTPVDLRVVPEPGAASDIVYLTGFADGAGWYELCDPDGAGLRVEWDATLMPYLWYWQEFGASTAPPWFGRLYVIGLEPFAGYPTNGLAEAVANGSALTLEPHVRRAHTMRIGLLPDPDEGEGS